MPRYIRNTVILAKIEAASGTDAVPTGVANAIQVADMTITPLDANNVEMSVISGYFGNNLALVGTASVKCSFSCYLQGSGTAATAPAWGALMQACANAEASLATPDRVEYTPASTSLKTATIYWYDDGVLHKLLGAFGNVKLSAKSGEAPKLSFDFVGIDGGVTAAANATPTLTAWKNPVAITKANVVDVTIGCSYSAGALSGGTAYNSTGISVDYGNQVQFAPMLSTEQVVLSDRKVSGSLSLELTAANEVTFIGNVKANTLQGIGFTVGTTTGYKTIIHMPNVQLINPRKEEFNGMRLIGFDMRVVPSSGNDEIRIVTV